MNFSTNQIVKSLASGATRTYRVRGYSREDGVTLVRVVPTQDHSGAVIPLKIPESELVSVE